jgi:hypothetical protein
MVMFNLLVNRQAKIGSIISDPESRRRTVP